ncbi:MAG: PhoH family protein [Planctomycetaceae bacterium]|nr:MAG: PhoH family protein [Planctomycetaceae bacterium]
MTESTLAVHSPEEVLALFGARDQHLRTIRRLFDVTITHRQGQIRISGEPTAVEQTTRVLERLRELGRRKGVLSPLDVRDAVAQEGLAEDGNTGPRAPVPDVEIRQAGRRVQPRTEGQSRYVEMIRTHDLTLATGPAGTGKTFLAVATAVESLKAEQIRKIVLVRPAVEAGENLGFLPGDLRAKLNPYLRPLLDALNDMVDFDQARNLMEREVIEVVPLAYMRGRTLNDAFIILDEAQNTTVPQMKMFLTRMGQRSKMVVSGDTSQLDLPKGVASGLADAVARLGRVPGVGVMGLAKSDIVRHRLVQRIVEAYEQQEG